MSRWKFRSLSVVVGLICLAVTNAAWGQRNSPDDEFGGGYSSLLPEQKRLVDDWFRRVSAVLKRAANPVEGYDTLPMSIRTTYNGVTHALLKTAMTDSSGKKLAASALDVVSKVDNVAGEVLGTGGDRQFRIYVQLKPNAMDLLDRSKEFKRTMDNTVYHKGFPICYRGAAGTPSIQISISRDMSRADIDVDYRSAKFPVSVVNGHLTSSNSDVRAGNNADRHNSQWDGLRAWWKNLLGLPVGPTEPVKVGGRTIAVQPRLKDAKPADAVYDFLSGWLVEQRANESVGYFAEQVFACVELEKNRKADRGVMRFELLQRMMTVNRKMGKVPTLSTVSQSVPYNNERVKLIEHSHADAFALFDVREDLAERFNCLNRLDSTEISAKALKSTAFGKYIGALFRLQYKGKPGEVVATLWQKQNGYWKLISFEVDPGLESSNSLNVAEAAPVSAPLQFIEGDKEMIAASTAFFTDWIVKRNVDRALTYAAPECFPCVNHYRANIPAARTLASQRALLKKGMVRLDDAIGAVDNLSDGIAAPDPDHPDLKIVKHANQKAFLIASIPDAMGDAASCANRRPDGEPDFKRGAASGYGKYYATGFLLNDGTGEGGVFWIAWAKRNNTWKAVSYVLLTP